jgi:ubiquitin C-terminal hydrolase
MDAKDFGKNSRRGIVGLQNLGNTCFMNASLQCLSYIKTLRNYFIFDFHKGDLNRESDYGTKGKLAEAYGGLLKQMWLGKNIKANPFEVKEALGKSIEKFRGTGQ